MIFIDPYIIILLKYRYLNFFIIKYKMFNVFSELKLSGSLYNRSRNTTKFAVLHKNTYTKATIYG